MERPKYPQRSINYASGDFALSALSTKFSLDLTTNTILGQPLRGYSLGEGATLLGRGISIEYEASHLMAFACQGLGAGKVLAKDSK